MRKEWSVMEVIDPKTGKVRRHYKYKGKACKRITLDTHMSRQLAGYVLIEKDLRSASLWLNEIDKIRGKDMNLEGSHHTKDRERYNIVKGLFVAALTFYGKAFAQCEGRRVKLERMQIAADFLNVHDHAISFRNNFAAHSGAELIERAEIALVLPPKSTRMIIPNIYREMTQPDFAAQPKGEKTFAELTEHARSIALCKIAQLNEKILKEEVLPKGYAYWNSK